MEKIGKSGFAEMENGTETLDFLPAALGQSYPQQNPQGDEPARANASGQSLGKPLNIGQVATVLGCSVWTVRQRYLPQGLPCIRASRSGKLVFFEEQVINWILKRQQQKGGLR